MFHNVSFRGKTHLLLNNDFDAKINHWLQNAIFSFFVLLIRCSNLLLGNEFMAMTENQFEDIYKINYSFLVNVAFGVLKDRDDARDIVQQVFLKLWNLRNEVNFDQNMRAYLHRSVINTSLNFIDKNKRIVNEEQSAANIFDSLQVKPNSDYLSDEVELAIKKAIAALPDKCQTVFNLSRFSDLSNKEIAEELSISLKAVEKHISKALRDLRVSLKPYMDLIHVFLFLGVGQFMFQLFYN
jgi:RNA polymerase sigma-70 factor (ECF subfamily)